MILVDTNYFLRAIVIPKTEADQAMNEQAQRLFLDLHEGRRAATTSDAVIAEVIYVLTGSVYSMRMIDVVDRLRPLLQVNGLHAANKRHWDHALDLLEQRPGLKFVDALLVAIAIAENHELATFDRALSRYPGISIYSSRQRSVD